MPSESTVTIPHPAPPVAAAPRAPEPPPEPAPMPDHPCHCNLADMAKVGVVDYYQNKPGAPREGICRGCGGSVPEQPGFAIKSSYGHAHPRPPLSMLNRL